jgi:carbon-monoxide dehydrogenase small subunit
MDQGIEFQLNGERISYTGSATTRLLDVLRDNFALTGVKCGCKEGECGACSVLLDGKLVNSCMVAMGRVAGASIVTIEGYSKTARFAALNAAYAAVSAVQCGVAHSRMILARRSHPRKTPPHPTKEEIRAGISGNLCRCTGYNAIVTRDSICRKGGQTDYGKRIQPQFAPAGTENPRGKRRDPIRRRHRI